MFRSLCYSVLILIAIIISCTGQTFQYSRGWTNGKRAPSQSHFHADATPDEIYQLAESDKRLERCIVQLQRFIHNPFLIRPSLAANGIDVNSNSNLFPNGDSTIGGSGGRAHHQSNEYFEDLASLEPVEFSTKRN